MVWFLKPIADAIASLKKIVLSCQLSNDLQFHSVIEGQRLILDELRAIKSLLTPPQLPPAPPPFGESRAISEREHLGEDGMSHKLVTYETELPEEKTSGTPNFDVDRQRVRVEVEGVEMDNQVLPIAATKVTFEVEANKSVKLFRTLIDTDELETELEDAATQEFVSKGNIPPTAPGAFGAMKVIGEREIPHDPVPAPE